VAGKLDPVFKEYCSRFSPLIQKRLKELHQIISKAAPKADVVISYGMPAYKMENVIVTLQATKTTSVFTQPHRVLKLSKKSSKTSTQVEALFNSNIPRKSLNT